MKEKYFTDDNIDQESNEMIEEVKYYSGMRMVKPDEGHIALLVMDMQNYFLDPDEHAFVPSAPTVVSNIINVMNACKEKDIPVILTKHVNTEEDAGMMGVRWHELIKDGIKRSEIIDEIKKIGGEVMKKGQFDAFYGTDLEEKLREKDIKQLIITGVMTNLCCETTARSAFIRGFDVIMPVDATAAYNYEFHLATFLNLAYMFTRPVKTESLVGMLKNA